jgi:uncharacterized repeat protein (TIGR04076 family)
MAQKPSRVKITVIKMLGMSELFGSKIPPTREGYEDKCPMYKVGDEFMIDEKGNMPNGFCSWAWYDLYRDFTTIRYGGNFNWVKEKGLNYVSCSDGLRPVIFKIERIEG